MFSRVVITFSCLNLPYASEAPYPHLILRRLRHSEHINIGVKFGSIGAKKLQSFSFFFSQYA